MKWLLPCLLALAWPASAQEILIYRCTDAQGHLTVQNQPCPKGSRQEKRSMQTPTAAPLPAISTVVAPPPPPPAEAKPAAAPVAPPPPVVEKPAPPTLYDCKRRDETRYFAEQLADTSYCMPLQVTGLDGNPSTGAGEACEVVKDRCTEVGGESLCSAWRQRLEEAETHWRFATPEHAAALQQEYARVRDLIAASSCADGAAQKP